MSNFERNKEKIKATIIYILQKISSSKSFGPSQKIRLLLIKMIPKEFHENHGVNVTVINVEIWEKRRDNDILLKTVKDLRNAESFFIISNIKIEEPETAYQINDLVFHCNIQEGKIKTCSEDNIDVLKTEGEDAEGIVYYFIRYAVKAINMFIKIYETTISKST